MTNIEALQTQVDQVKTDLASLKKETNEALKKTKAEVAAEKVKTAKEEITKKLEALKGLTDANSKADVVKLEAMLKTLETSDLELTTLKMDVTIPSTENKDKDEKPGEVPLGGLDPSITKPNWLKRQIIGFSDSNEENHILKNTARIAGGIGAAVLVYKGIKRLFGGDKKKEENKEGGDKKTEEPGFRKTGFGKFLKWTGIGTGAYYLTHGLVTGRWNLKDFFDWSKKNIEDDPKNLQEWFDKLPEWKRIKYNEFADMVDKYNAGLNSSTILGSMIDKSGKSITIPGGAVPAIMDTIYENVGDIINNDSYISDKWTQVSHKLSDFVTSIGEKAVKYVFSPMVGLIKGLTGDMFDKEGKPNEKFTDWANTKDEDRDVQIGRMMEKYGDVRSFLLAKKQQLEEKYAAQQIGGTPTKQQINDYLDDSDNKKIIDERVEMAFLNKKIVGATDADSAIIAMKQDNVFDETSDPELKKLADEVKERKKEVVGDETIFNQAMNSLDVNKDPALKQKLQEISVNFSKKIDDGFLEGNFIESFCAWSGLRLDELWNSNSNDRLIILDELQFSPRMKEIRSKNALFMNKLSAGKITKTDIEEFKSNIDEYFEMEQDIVVRGKQRNIDDANKGFWDRAFSRGKDRFTTVATRVMTPQGIGISVAVLGVNYLTRGWLFKAAGNIIGWPIKKIGNVTWKTLSFTAESALRRVNIASGTRLNNYMKYKLYGKGDFGKFTTDVKKGMLEMSEIEYVYINRSADWNVQGKSLNQFISDSFNLKEGEEVQLFRDYFQGNIRKLAKRNNFKASDLVKKIKVYDTKINTLIGDRKIFCKELFENSSFKNLDDIDNIIKNIDDIDITQIPPKEFKKIAKALGKDISNLKDAKDINAKIAEIKKGINVVSDLTDAQKNIAKYIDQDIVELTDFIHRDVPKMPGYQLNDTADLFYKGQLTKLQEFKTQIKGFTNEEMTAFDILRKLEFKSHHIIELLELKSITAVGGEFKKLENGAGDLSGLLRQLEYSKSKGTLISDTLIETIKDIHLKNAVKGGEFIQNIMKFFKFLAKAT